MKKNENQKQPVELNRNKYDDLEFEADNPVDYMDAILEKTGLDYSRHTAETGTTYYELTDNEGKVYKIRYADHPQKYGENYRDIRYNENSSIEDIAEEFSNNVLFDSKGKLWNDYKFKKSDDNIKLFS